MAGRPWCGSRRSWMCRSRTACGGLSTRPSSAGWPAISQLGLVSLVYPAAIHTRFEHSLGVYRLALLFLKRLSYDARFAAAIDRRQTPSVFLVAALLHDLGHWPFCHPIEDIRLPGVPQPRAVRQQRFCSRARCADALRDDWGIEPRDVVALLSDEPADAARPHSAPACSPARSTSTRWTTCPATACTRACPTAAISTSRG